MIFKYSFESIIAIKISNKKITEIMHHIEKLIWSIGFKHKIPRCVENYVFISDFCSLSADNYWSHKD